MTVFDSEFYIRFSSASFGEFTVYVQKRRKVAKHIPRTHDYDHVHLNGVCVCVCVCVRACVRMRVSVRACVRACTRL